jgi:hypothetical protein
MAPIHPNQSHIEITVLLENFTFKACVELTCRFLTTASTLSTGAARSLALLEIEILFIPEYSSMAWTDSDQILAVGRQQRRRCWRQDAGT